MSPTLGLDSIRARIVAVVVVALLALLGSQLWLVKSQPPIRENLALLARGYLPLESRLLVLESDIARADRDLVRLRRERQRPEPGAKSVAEISLEDVRANLEGTWPLLVTLADLAPSASEARDVTYLTTLMGHLEDAVDTHELAMQLYIGQADQQRDADPLEMGRPPKLQVRVADDLGKLRKRVRDRIETVSDETLRLQTEATALAIAFAGAASLVALVLVGAVLNALRPIGRLTEEVQRLAAGEVGGRVEVGGADEVGMLAREFNAMARAIELRDRTLKERAEELNRLSRYLGSVVDSLEDGLVVVEAGVVTLTNPAAERAWGAQRDASPPPMLAEALSAPGLHDLSGPGARRTVVRAVAFGDAGLVAVLSDVTEQLAAQEALARSERLALVGQMLAQITHEVRNPLNALSLNAELLEEELGQLDPERQNEAWELLAMIASEVDRLTAVTGHYLQLARRPPAELAPDDLGAMVREVARLVAPELRAAGLAIDLDLLPVPSQLVDGNQLRRALLNVLRNASESGGTRLRVTLTADAHTVRLAIGDDGEGMDEQQIARAFDPFYSTKDTGTGLGLAITRQILEDHGGQVSIDASADRGTTLTLVLPRRDASELTRQTLDQEPTA